MRILFDKNVPIPLLQYLAGYDVRTAEEVGWARLMNGGLLRAAEDAGFGVMVTADQSIEYRQNLKGRKLALVVLSTNHVGILEWHPKRLVATVECRNGRQLPVREVRIAAKAETLPDWTSRLASQSGIRNCAVERTALLLAGLLQ